MNRDNYNRSVSSADQAFKGWCASKNIPLHGIQHVITWEDWDDGIGVYIFLETMKQREKLGSDEIDEMKNCYLSFLRDFGYPFDKFPNVVLEFDSDENVRKNYAGSYFYRLR
ncbi:MAG: hypothetical protein ACK49R_17255 [Planctomycetota bacterium]|jgi:hypothetical protein